MENFSATFLQEVIQVVEQIEPKKIEQIAQGLAEIRQQQGRLFFLGVGGSAGNCGHAVNDFRKICGFEAYAPTDNVSELTARINDDGWQSVFANWLKGSQLKKDDGLFIFSVGGGNLEKNVSANLVKAIELAKVRGTRIFGVVGKDGGFTAQSSETVLIIPTINSQHITPHTEAFQAVIWHLLVSHPLLKQNETKWEATQ